MKYLPAVASGPPTLDVVHHCDALTLLRGLPDASVDLVVTSPPYNMRTTTNGATPCSTSDNNWGKSKLLFGGYGDYQDNMPYEQYVAWQRDVLTQCLRVIKDTGAIFYNHKWRIQAGLLDMRNDIVAGFPVRQVIIWDRGGGLNHNKAFFVPCYEVVYLIAKRQFYLLQEKASIYGDVWHIPGEANSPHPAPFPIELAHRCISSTTAEIILDPFMGSGTTALAAKRLGRHYVGCDLNPEYVKLCKERLRMPFEQHYIERGENLSDLPLFAAPSQTALFEVER